MTFGKNITINRVNKSTENTLQNERRGIDTIKNNAF
jgi:hypothetical protein